MINIELEVQSSNKRLAECDNLEISDAKRSKIEENLKKRKMCVLLMTYSGVGYFGMQRNVGFKTIEGDLFDALLASNLIDQSSYDFPSKIRFQRASKTDKNVSASGQVCSLKIPDDENVVELLNSHLPNEILVLDVFRTTKNFHAKSLCKNRTYRYITPSFAFAPREIERDELYNYRITLERVNLINETLSNYKGTHNFHNFTSGRSATEKSCQRYMVNVSCESPFVRDDIEYIAIVINGQSFMLHQIRKMLGLAMAVVRGYSDNSVFAKAFSVEKVDIPRAPGLGLILDRVNYDYYNSKHCGDSGRQAIDWSKYEDQLIEFREKNIYSHIYKMEKEEGHMFTWLDTLAIHTYTYRLIPSTEPQPSDN